MMIIAMLVIGLTLVWVGVWERRWHQENVDQIRLRININGSRGKSTVTRLVTAILQEAGERVIGKTTGSAARLIYWFTSEEQAIRRGPLGPTIAEQKMVVAEAAAQQASVLVSECMALKPAYQRVFQERYLQAQVMVVTNVLADHLDVMGPTVEDVAKVFAATTPVGGKMVIAPGPYVSIFATVAQERNTELVIADVTAVTEEQLQQFSYLLFAENVALALAVADALGIERDVAWRGMLRAKPDIGALQCLQVTNHARFFNGFAANDPYSALQVWRKIEEQPFPSAQPLVILNCRADRVDRTQQFVNEVLLALPPHSLIAIGSRTDAIAQAIVAGDYQPLTYDDCEDAAMAQCLPVIMQRIAERAASGASVTVVGLGNIYGPALELVQHWQHLTQSVRGDEDVC